MIFAMKVPFVFLAGETAHGYAQATRLRKEALSITFCGSRHGDPPSPTEPKRAWTERLISADGVHA